MRPFLYERPETIDDVFALLGRAAPETSKLLAGGTDLLPLMKDQILAPNELIDIKRLVEIDDQIELTADGLRIGALATLAEIENNPFVRADYAALSQAAGLAASPQLRNMATIGGNLLQRPRCWYFRDHEVHCWLKGGEECFAVEGENQLHAIFDGSPCHAVHPSDLATALLMFGASVVARGATHERTIAMEDFFALPKYDHRIEHTLRPDEIIVAVTLPSRPATARSVYLKAMDRAVWAFALIGVAALLDVQEGRIAEARLVLSGAAPIPWRVAKADSLLLNSTPGPKIFGDAARLAMDGAEPLSQNAYKLPLAEALILRALAAAAPSGAMPS